MHFGAFSTPIVDVISCKRGFSIETTVCEVPVKLSFIATVALVLAIALGLTSVGIASAEAEDRPLKIILVQVQPPPGFPGDGITIAKPLTEPGKKPATVAKRRSVVDLKAAKAETAKLLAERAKVIAATKAARIHFAEIYAFTGVKITRQGCGEADAEAWAYFGTLPQEVQDAYGGKPPTVICEADR